MPVSKKLDGTSETGQEPVETRSGGQTIYPGRSSDGAAGSAVVRNPDSTNVTNQFSVKDAGSGHNTGSAAELYTADITPVRYYDNGDNGGNSSTEPLPHGYKDLYEGQLDATSSAASGGGNPGGNPGDNPGDNDNSDVIADFTECARVGGVVIVAIGVILGL
jgi:hypothetical protein